MGKRTERKLEEAAEQAGEGWMVRGEVLPRKSLCWGWTGPGTQVWRNPISWEESMIWSP